MREGFVMKTHEGETGRIADILSTQRAKHALAVRQSPFFSVFGNAVRMSVIHISR